MLKMRFDRFKVKREMGQIGIGTFKDLAKIADISPTTLYNTMDQYDWRSATIHSVAAALNCDPLNLLTVDSIDAAQPEESR